MFSFKLISGIVYPYILLFIVSGLFLLLYYKFLPIRFPILGIKILSGALDWRGSKGKITPGQAFFSGILGTFFPGLFVGLFLALSLAGPSVLLLIWFLHFLQASMEFTLSTVSFKFRIRNSNGDLETGLLLGMEKYSRIRWFGFLYGVFFVISSLAYGIWIFSFLQVISFSHISPANDAFFSFEPVSIMILFLIFMILIFNGGIRRIGFYSKIVAYIMIILLFIIGISIQKSLNLLPVLFRDFPLLFRQDHIVNTIFAIVMYGIFAEVPNFRLNIFSGLVRTDHSAKQGIATMIYPMIQSFVSFLLAGRFYEFIQNHHLELSYIGNLPEFLAIFHLEYLLNLITYGRNHILTLILIFLLLLILLFSSFLTWFLTGNIILRQIVSRFKISNFYPALAIFLYLYLIFFWDWNSKKILINFYMIFIFLIGITAIFSIVFSLIYHNLGKYELQKYQDSYEGGVDFSRDLFVMFFTILPSNLLSKIFGWISLIQFPQPLMFWMIKGFAKMYKINLQEVKKDLREFKNLNEFFIRELKEEVRSIDTRRKIIVSPVDALLSRRGTIQEGLLIQTKGIFYTLKDLLGDPEYVSYFENGKYCVLYLSPQDYHRIHAPFDCEIEGYTYSPGYLFPVNEPAVEGLYGLFPKNERLTTFLKTRYGKIAMVKVGATNVGKIRVMYDSIRTNTWIRRKKAIQYQHKIIFQKGQEMARFEMGSTVILIFEKDTVQFLDTALEGIKVQFGLGIAKFQ